MSLYHKYRPQSLDEIIGNADVVSYLVNLFEGGKDIPHAFLLHGPTGCGKTTTARIIANELNCSPVDFKEMNIADMRGIDTIREIIKNSSYSPLEGDCRIWLIDECHKMTTDAQDAFLKILEDTPPHVYFILSTTDPQKLLTTVKGRCIELKMSLLDEKEMFSLLRKVVKDEDEKISKSIYEIIMENAAGHPRNALQILEQVLQVAPEQQASIAEKVAAEQNQSIDLCRALIEKTPWKKVSNILSGLENQDAESIRRHVLGYAKSVLLKNENDRAALVIQEFRDPLYDIGFPGLVFYCYSVTKG